MLSKQVTLGSVIGETQLAMIGNTALHPLSYPLTLDTILRHGPGLHGIYVPASCVSTNPSLGPGSAIF